MAFGRNTNLLSLVEKNSIEEKTTSSHSDIMRNYNIVPMCESVLFSYSRVPSLTFHSKTDNSLIVERKKAIGLLCR